MLPYIGFFLIFFPVQCVGTPPPPPVSVYIVPEAENIKIPAQSIILLKHLYTPAVCSERGGGQSGNPFPLGQVKQTWV